MERIGTDGSAGTASENDIYMQQNYLNKETCMAINDLIGIANPSGDALTNITATGTVTRFFDVNAISNATAIFTLNALAGEPKWCWYYGSGATKTYVYVAMIVER